MSLYSEKVMDHFRNPRNVGVSENPDGVGEVGNAKCGDIMKMYIKVENGILVDVKFETFGCGSAIASSSMATEMIKGKPLKEALLLTNRAVTEALGGLPAHKLHCSVLAEEAVQAAVRDYYQRTFPPSTMNTTSTAGRNSDRLHAGGICPAAHGCACGEGGFLSAEGNFPRQQYPA